MCGPLVLALPGARLPFWQRWANRLHYHLGRSLTYMILGSIVGIIGAGIELFTWQRAVALVGGLAMVLLVLLPKVAHKLHSRGTVAKTISQSRQKLFGQLTKSRWYAWTGLGALNGLLPCGPLYVALAGALATGTWAGGGLFMLLFGAGTAVMLFILHFVRDRVPTVGARLSVVLPWITAAVGLLLILRGLDLDIPYLSPAFNYAEGSASGCH